MHRHTFPPPLPDKREVWGKGKLIDSTEVCQPSPHFSRLQVTEGIAGIKSDLLTAGWQYHNLTEKVGQDVEDCSTDCKLLWLLLT